MIWYWLIFSIVLFFCIIDIFKISIRTFYKKSLLSGLIILLGLFAGLRFECDNDYLEYVRIYSQAPTLGEFFAGGYNLTDVYGEPFFVITNILFKTIKAPDYIFLTFISFLNLFFLYKVIVGFSKYWFLSLFLYVALMYLGGGFTQIRFGVATTLVWYGILQYFKGRFKLSIVILICATMFHISAASAVIIYFANRFLKLNLKIILCILTVSIAITFFSFSDFFVRFIGVFFGDSRYENYFLLENYTEKASSFSIYFYSFNLLIYWFFRKQMIRNSSKDLFLFFFKIGITAVFFGAIFNQMAILARFGLILQFVFIFILPYTFGIKPMRIIMLAFLILYGAFRFNQYLGEESFIQEYQSVIFNK